MRTIDKDKQLAVKQAVFDLAINEGLINISMGKVAKLAGVSPATLYIYYQDKTDMISRIYEEVKDLMDDQLDKKLEEVEDVDEKYRMFAWHFVRRFRQYPKQAIFMGQVQNNPSLIDHKAYEYSVQRAQPVSDLWEEIQMDNRYAKISQEAAIEMARLPLNALEHNPEIVDEVISEIIEMSLKAMKK